MYLGQIMEKGATEEIFSPPYHPYTEALLAAVPIADANVTKRKIVLQGELPSPSNPPKGCPFSTRCPYMMKGVCDTEAPPQREFGPRHVIACHLDRETLLAMQPVIVVGPEIAEGGPPPPVGPAQQAQGHA
jgi:peptide/nickel transport system ATP-binding protein